MSDKSVETCDLGFPANYGSTQKGIKWVLEQQKEDRKGCICRQVTSISRDNLNVLFTTCLRDLTTKVLGYMPLHCI